MWLYNNLEVDQVLSKLHNQSKNPQENNFFLTQIESCPNWSSHILRGWTYPDSPVSYYLNYLYNMWKSIKKCFKSVANLQSLFYRDSFGLCGSLGRSLGHFLKKWDSNSNNSWESFKSMDETYHISTTLWIWNYL